jgi:LuxR family transcriptional regulator, maltose regulon positive regulatory protein
MEPAESAYPPLFRHHARRPRLTRLLDESTAQAIVITAPAGYGKTTLAMEWLQGRDDVVWYRATNASADVAAFSAGLTDVIARLVPGAGERLKQRLRVADTPERAARPLAELLAEDLATWPERALLVVDDYHLVADSEPVEDFFDWLLTLARQLRVLVTGRRRPRWASARRILYGEITEIDRDRLAMNAEDAARVLSDRSDEAVRTLVAQAEGWPALIGLAALTAAREVPEERVSDALYRYFAEEVLRGKTPEVERFMLVASVPSTIDGQIAREVLRVEEPEETIASLVSEGLLHAVDDGFRFHPLLRTFLRRKLESEEPAVHAELVRRAIESARAARRWEEAFDLAIETGPLDVAVAILEDAMVDLLAAGQVELLQRWLDECGDLAVDHPGTNIARSELLIRQGSCSEAVGLARSLAMRLPSSDHRKSRAWYLAGLASHLGSDESDALEAHLQARKFASTAQEVGDALWGAHLAASELGMDSASDYLAEMEALGRSDLAFRARVATGQIGARMASGSLQGVTRIFDPLVPLIEHISDPMAATSFLARVAEAQILRGYYEPALYFASRALTVAESLQLDFAVGLCLLPKMVGEVGLRRFGDARRTLKSLTKIAVAREDPYLEVARQMGHLRLAISSPHHRFEESGLPTHSWANVQISVRSEYLSLRALYTARRGDPAVAIQFASDAQQLSHGVESTFNARFAEHIAETTGRTGSRRSRHDLVGLVLECAQAEAFDSLVLACRADPQIAARIADEPNLSAIVRRALRRSKDTVIAIRAGLTSDEAGSVDGHSLRSVLTPRETEVLDLLSTGLSNAAIAERLVITESTVKVHVHHILEKLGVETRLQAVLKAAEITDT